MTFTRGNIIVENIKIGDIHYEYFYNFGVKSQVISLPVRNSEGVWHWKALNLNTNKEIDYVVNEEYYWISSPNIYDCEAYEIKTWL